MEMSPVHAIKKMGFDERLGNLNGMYGSGTYSPFIAGAPPPNGLAT